MRFAYIKKGTSILRAYPPKSLAVLPLIIRSDHYMDAVIAACAFPIPCVDIFVVLDCQAVRVFLELRCEGFLGQGLLYIVLAPPLVCGVNLPCRRVGVRLEADISLCFVGASEGRTVTAGDV